MGKITQCRCESLPCYGLPHRNITSKGEITLGHFFTFLPTPGDIADCLEATARKERPHPIDTRYAWFSRPCQST